MKLRDFTVKIFLFFFFLLLFFYYWIFFFVPAFAKFAAIFPDKFSDALLESLEDVDFKGNESWGCQHSKVWVVFLGIGCCSEDD